MVVLESKFMPSKKSTMSISSTNSIPSPVSLGRTALNLLYKEITRASATGLILNSSFRQALKSIRQIVAKKKQSVKNYSNTG